jgi:Family of unknown function (DUF5996)
MWSQVVGKVRLAVEPPVNHWWQVPLYVSARGLTTSLVHFPDQGIEMEFDFLDHQLQLRSTTGERRSVALEPRSVASFYEATMNALGELGVQVEMMARPVEVVVATPFAQDTEHHSYDADAMTRFWRALLQADRLFRTFRARFTGKASPVHFFWGGFDLATTRFSGRPGPLHPGGAPNCPDWVMVEAYNRELASCGFWPGGSEEASFYAYAYPEPPGFADHTAGTPAGRYDTDLREFILPYRDVRTAADPDAVLLDFLQATYEAAADLGGWDRAALEGAVHSGSP